MAKTATLTSKRSTVPWGRQSSGVICTWKIYQLFCDSGAALADFFTFMKMLPNVSFISMVIKKVFLSVSIATISTFLQKFTLWRHNYETFQPKIGQCDAVDINWILPFYFFLFARPNSKPLCTCLGADIGDMRPSFWFLGYVHLFYQSLWEQIY